MRLIYTIISAINCVVVIFGIVGNSLVIAVVKKTRSMRTTTNFLLVNLAVADITTHLFNPLLHGDLWPTNLNSDFLCKFLTGNGFVGIPVLVSVFTLVILAVERYHALVKPMATRLRLTMENFHYAIIMTWIAAIALNIPIIVDYREEKYKCIGVWELDFTDCLAWYMVFFIIMVISSAFVIGICYFQIFRGLYITNTICSESTSTDEERKSKKKLAKTLAIVTFIFYITVLPGAIFTLYMAIKRKQETLDGILLVVFSLLILFNSCVNPIIYAFQSENYKSGFKKIFRCYASSNEIDHQRASSPNEHNVYL